MINAQLFGSEQKSSLTIKEGFYDTFIPVSRCNNCFMSS